MRYEQFRYLYPPRPEQAIAKPMMNFYQKKNWFAQAKMNGTCNVIAVGPDRELIAMTRHNDKHKMWNWTPASSEAFKAVRGNGWFVFVAELMHSKTPHIKDTNYINDIIVAENEHLVGMTYSERQKLLAAIFLTGDEKETDTHFIINNNTWLAKNHTENFAQKFAEWTQSEVEGLVLKNPNAPLLPCFKPTANAGWAVKIRKATKNYSF